MTKKADFTAEEWQCIVSAPRMVGIAVAAASPSGPVGAVKEMVALGKSLEEVAERGRSYFRSGRQSEGTRYAARGAAGAYRFGKSGEGEPRSLARTSCEKLN